MYSKAVTKALGVTKSACSAAKKRNAAHIAAGGVHLRQNREKKKRKDDVDSALGPYVWDFCHNPYGPHYIDTFRGACKVRGLDGETEAHQIRIWEGMMNWHQKLAAFEKSPEYIVFKTKHPNMNVTAPRLKKLCCKCVQNPKATSCAEEFITTLDECLCTIRRQHNHDHEFSNKVEAYLDTLAPDEKEAFQHFQDILYTKRPHDFAEAALCPLTPFPDLAMNAGMIVVFFISHR